MTYSLGHLVARRLSVGLNLLCVAAIIAVFAGLLAFGEGVNRALVVSAAADKVVAVRNGATSETNSSVEQEQFLRMAALPHLARENGQSLISPEVMVQTSLIRRGSADGVTANVAVRGVDEIAFRVHPRVRVVRGRLFDPGRYEVIVGTAAHDRFEGLEIGEQIPLGFSNERFRVVGIFEADEGPRESEIWGYRSHIADVHKRTGGMSSVWLRVDEATAINEVIEEIKGPSIHLDARSERDYYAELDINAGWIRAVTLSLILFMGTGAAFGIANTEYASVIHRTAEVGMLRALGFSRGAILAAILTEAVLLSLIGGAIGCLAALFLNGRTQDMMSAGFTTVAFEFRVSPSIMMISLLAASLIGFFGALHPAWRASRLAVVTALRGE